MDLLLSCKQSVGNVTVNNELVYEVLKDYSDVTENGRHIVFCWVSGHVGITGNEMAEKAAKAGLSVSSN